MKIVPICFALPALVIAAGCAAPALQAAPKKAAPMAHAMLMSGDGQDRGMAMVTEAPDGLHVVVKATGLPPGMHAVHVHTTGTCTAPDFTSAGGHWNPTAHKHGKDNPAGMHMGDMPNVLASTDGTAALEYVIPGGKLSSGPMPLLDADGAAIVIHAQADDNRTDPAGNAGGRIACGVLKAG